MNTKSLYQEVILDHNRNPRNYGSLDNANCSAEGHKPLCGDHLNIALNLSRGYISDIVFQGESCAICKASASMMTANVKGKTQADAETLIQEFREMAIGKLEPDSNHHLGRLTVFSGICDLPTRVKCAILPWHTLHAALNSVATISTEADDDPMHVSIGNA